MKISLFLLSLGVLLMPSCVYVQTHKNVEQIGSTTPMGKLERDRLYRVGDDWCLRAHEVNTKLDYPLIRDEAFTGNTRPAIVSEVGPLSEEPIYIPVSEGTAAVMQREDGYVHIGDLVSEMERFKRHYTAEQARGKVRPAGAIRAEAAGESGAVFVNLGKPSSPSAVGSVLGTADLVFVDTPATLAANALLPVIAPFYFFVDFLSH
ncbi:MAG: hypothetical protein ACI4OZ_07480 [Akkermansia sp.]